MSRLLRLSDIIFGVRTQHISVVSNKGVRAWTRYHGELGNRIVGNGDLILDLDDTKAVSEFVASGVLDRWAAALDFSLEGFDRTEAFYAIAAATLRPAFSSLVPNAAGLTTTGRYAETGHFRLRVQRDFIITVLVEVFDGPFYDAPEFWDAVQRRLGPAAAAWAYLG